MDLNKFSDPVFLLPTVLLMVSLVILIGLVAYILKAKKVVRPRIKKRIIVNKNITPLTYRPQPTTEQCEITIENCCNMNVCETVSNKCFWFVVGFYCFVWFIAVFRAAYIEELSETR